MRTLLIVLTLAALACVVPSALPVSAPAQPVQPATTTPTPGVSRTPEPAPLVRTFTVTATRLYIRDREESVSGYLHQGDFVSCLPTYDKDGEPTGWCLIGQGLKVWAGCLDPNPSGLGCEPK